MLQFTGSDELLFSAKARYVLSEVLIQNRDLNVFWSAYDPLDLASDSIDPLGFLAGYSTLLPVTHMPMTVLAVKMHSGRAGRAIDDPAGRHA